MSNPNQVGAFIPTTQVWDTTDIYTADIPDALKELLVRMYQNLNRMALQTNIKDSGYYDTVGEFVNGQLYFPNPLYNSSSSPAITPAFRQVLRKVINFGSLPNTGTTSVAHGITCTAMTTFTRIYGAASDTTGFNYIPLPYASNTAGSSIELSVDGTNVNVTTGSNRTNFNVTYIVLEYLQN